jgi:hypothetical protein
MTVSWNGNTDQIDVQRQEETDADGKTTTTATYTLNGNALDADQMEALFQSITGSERNPPRTATRAQPRTSRSLLCETAPPSAASRWSWSPTTPTSIWSASPAKTIFWSTAFRADLTGLLENL